mmetsp:Transcript_21835/g.33190  ORF Transcript_21835/g.33190 Transcript_21835/m.33190 type:complete len:163 (-) Transcript_21835:225-713(-)
MRSTCQLILHQRRHNLFQRTSLKDSPSQLFKMSLATAAHAEFPVEASIIRKLVCQLQPSVLDVINESHMHNVPTNSETHFKVVVVAEQFSDVRSLVKRHRLINSILKDEIATEGPVHALSIVAKSPDQWEKMIDKSNGEENIVIGSSPNCRGGDGSLPPKRS